MENLFTNNSLIDCLQDSRRFLGNICILPTDCVLHDLCSHVGRSLTISRNAKHTSNDIEVIFHNNTTMKHQQHKQYQQIKLEMGRKTAIEETEGK